MNVERVAVAGVVVERRRKLEVHDVREIKLRSHLPAEQERISPGDKLRFPCCRLLGCGARANWIFRVIVVINELAEIRENIDFQERLCRRGCNDLAILAI
jgi:hypothetical protein